MFFFSHTSVHSVGEETRDWMEDGWPAVKMDTWQWVGHSYILGGSLSMESVLRIPFGFGSMKEENTHQS